MARRGRTPSTKKKPTELKTVSTEFKSSNPLDALMKPLPSHNPIIDVEQLRQDINSEFGDNALIYGNDPSIRDKRPRISTGSLALDYRFGGYSKGRVNTVSGLSGVGKSHLLLKCIAWYLKMFPSEVVALINSEDSYEEEFAIMAGIDVHNPNFLVNLPESLEEALKIARRLQKAGVGFIGIDSIESLATDKDLETDEGEKKQMGEKQKMISNFLKVIINRNNKAKRQGQDGTTFILVQQLREKIGIVFGDPLFETGGQGLQYYPHVKIRLMESGKEKDPKTKRVKRSTITGTTTKSRLVGKGISASYYFNYFTDDGTPTGIDHFEELIDIADEEGIIQQLSAQKYDIYGKELKRNERRKYLVNNPDVLEQLYFDVMKVVKARMGHDKLEDQPEEPTKVEKKTTSRRKK
jgi:recombination protein RecA